MSEEPTDKPKTRRMKPLVFKDAMKSLRNSRGLHCSDCEKWHKSYCSITCQAKQKSSPMCHYGAQLRNIELSKARQSERKGKSE